MFLDVFMFIQATVTPLLGRTPEMVFLGLVAVVAIEVVIGIMVWAILPDLQRLDRWLMSVLEEGTPPGESSRGGLPATLPDVVARDIHRVARGGR